MRKRVSVAVQPGNLTGCLNHTHGLLRWIYFLVECARDKGIAIGELGEAGKCQRRSSETLPGQTGAEKLQIYLTKGRASAMVMGVGRQGPRGSGW
jgi:hypothetical protein